jgi:hypothetical protein
MREDKRGPAERGSILVEEGNPATDSARARTDAPSSADQADQTSTAPDQTSTPADQAVAAQPDLAGTGSAAGPETGNAPAAEPGGPRLGEPGPLSPEPPASPAGDDPVPGDHPTGPNPVINPTGPNPIVRSVPAGDADEPDVVEVSSPGHEAIRSGTGEPGDQPGRSGTAEPGDEPSRSSTAEPRHQPEPSGTAEPRHQASRAGTTEPAEEPGPPGTGAPGDAVEPARAAEPAGTVEPARAAEAARAQPERLPARRWEPAAAPAPEPSWGKVLATTISLWTSRRFGRLTGRSRRPGTVAVYGATDAPSPRRGGIRWPLVVFVLVLIILALVGLQLSGALSSNQPSRPAGRSGGATGNSGSLSGAEAARNHAAGWIAQQVTSSDVIACDPLMCSILQSDGVAASRLTSMQPTTPDPLGTDVVVATAAIRSQFGSRLTTEYAPELIASFGSGASRVDVRAVANYGAAAFQASEQADLAARKSAGAQLLGKGFKIPAQGASQLRAGQVDSRLLVTLAALLSQRQVQVSSFGEASPGAPVLYRQVTIVNAAGQSGTSAMTADLSQVRAQRNSYLPAHAAIVRLTNGQSALRIEFGAPDQPGLLSGATS